MVQGAGLTNAQVANWKIVQARMTEVGLRDDVSFVEGLLKLQGQQAGLRKVQHIVNVDCQGGEPFSSKVRNCFGHFFVGAAASGLTMAGCKALLSGSISEPAKTDIIWGSAAIGLATAVTSHSAGSAAVHGMVFGGIAAATVAATDAQEGVFSGKMNEGMQFLGGKAFDTADWLNDKACELSKSKYFCKPTIREKSVFDGATENKNEKVDVLEETGRFTCDLNDNKNEMSNAELDSQFMFTSEE